jgi:hypothetical protein
LKSGHLDGRSRGVNLPGRLGAKHRGIAMDSQVISAVYVPPKAGLPFLAVTISHDGTVLAVPFHTLIAAEAHNNYRAQELAKKHQGESHTDRT